MLHVLGVVEGCGLKATSKKKFRKLNVNLDYLDATPHEVTDNIVSLYEKDLQIWIKISQQKTRPFSECLVHHLSESKPSLRMCKPRLTSVNENRTPKAIDT